MKKAIKTILTIYMLLLLTVTFGINNNNISLLAATKDVYKRQVYLKVPENIWVDLKQ